MILPGHTRLRIPYEATDFPSGSGLNGHGGLRLTWDDVLWATMTVGRARRDVLRHGRYSSADLMHRVACMCAYFDIRGGRLVRSDAFTTLDPSEKAIASFYLGMAMAKVYADQVLGIPWLMHISRYEVAWAVKYGANTKRPDLFGCNSVGDWAVAEAKGRDRVTGALVAKMRTQKSSVATINGAAPTHRYGASTRFPEGRLALRIVDPPPRHDAQEIPINPAAWLVDYYTPIVDLIAESGQIEGRYVIGRIPNSDIEVGLPERVAALVNETRQRQFERPGPRRAHAVLDDMETELRLAGQARPDGVALVERVTEAIRDEQDVPDVFRDGLVVRSRR